MYQIKLAAISMMPLALLCSIATAQEMQQQCLVNTPPAPLKNEVYGPYVPYTGPLLGVVLRQCTMTAALPAADNAVSSVSSQRTTRLNTESQKDHGPFASDITPALTTSSSKCQPPPTPRKDEVYGSYVPYTGPLLGVVLPRCEVATIPSTDDTKTMLSSSPSLDLSAVQPPDSSARSASAQLKPALFTASDLAIAATPAPAEGSGGSGYVRVVAPPRPATIPEEVRPFHTLAIGFKADTLGLGVEFATPLAYRINLRSSINAFAFNDPFSIDGVGYDARLHLKASETTVDWFPRAGGLHISPGILYFKSSMSAPASVGPGRTFVLGTQTFLNSVDDPVTGSSSVVYPHAFAPMLLIGYGNIIPRSRGHLSVPFEFGAAYTGAPLISVALKGTACTTDGCVNFATNSQAQTFLKQEINNLNEDLKKYPFFPIVSLGVAYRF
jgi:hypothetical protein